MLTVNPGYIRPAAQLSLVQQQPGPEGHAGVLLNLQPQPVVKLAEQRPLLSVCFAAGTNHAKRTGYDTISGMSEKM